MALRRTITASIISEQGDVLRACLDSGRYRSVSEVVRAALRLLEREETSPQRSRSSPYSSASPRHGRG